MPSSFGCQLLRPFKKTILTKYELLTETLVVLNMAIFNTTESFYGIFNMEEIGDKINFVALLIFSSIVGQSSPSPIRK